MNFRLISKKTPDVISILSFVIFFILSCDSSESIQPLEQNKVDPFIQNKKIAKTINLGNALDAPNEGEWGVTLEAEYFQIIKSAGFSGVRLPVRWSHHTQANSPFTIDENFFKRVDWAVQNALDNDLAIVINIHHFEEIFSDPLAFKQKLLSLWEQIARHYKDYPDNIIFEMLNEPHQKLTSEIWNEFIAEGISLIRKIDNKRTLMIGPSNWNSINSLNTLEIPNDENLIITVHYYSPFEFTHQGASWVEDSDRWMGTTWDATNTQKELIDKDIAIVREWGIRNNRPIFIGEFGAYSKADFNSRFRWTEYMVQVMQKNEISWSYWEFCSGFGAWDQQTKKWNELLYALIQPN